MAAGQLVVDWRFLQECGGHAPWCLRHPCHRRPCNSLIPCSLVGPCLSRFAPFSALRVPKSLFLPCFPLCLGMWQCIAPPCSFFGVNSSLIPGPFSSHLPSLQFFRPREPLSLLWPVTSFPCFWCLYDLASVISSVRAGFLTCPCVNFSLHSQKLHRSFCFQSKVCAIVWPH